MPELHHLSYSSISTYLLCARAWRYRYVDKPDVPTATALVFGSAFHGALEAYVRGTKDLQASWIESWANQVESPRNHNIDWGTSGPNELDIEGQRILGAPKVVKAVADIAAQYDASDPVCALEKRVTLQVPGVPVPIIGYVDIITTDGVPGDFKTAARMWSASKAEEELQPLFYLAALNQEGVELPSWAFRHYVFSKGKQPYSKTFEVTHQATAIFSLFEVIQSAWDSIDRGAFPMSGVGSWKCKPQYCEYWGMCRGKYL